MQIYEYYISEHRIHMTGSYICIYIYIYLTEKLTDLTKIQKPFHGSVSISWYTYCHSNENSPALDPRPRKKSPTGKTRSFLKKIYVGDVHGWYLGSMDYI